MRPRTQEQTEAEVIRLIGRYAGRGTRGFEIIDRAMQGRSDRVKRARAELVDAVQCRENHEASRRARMLVQIAGIELTYETPDGDDDGE